MSKSITILAPAQVRALFSNGTLKVTDVKDAKGNPVNPASIFGADGTGSKVRGRVHPAFAAHAEAKGHGTMREKVVAERTVEVPMFSPKTGRPVKSLTKPVSEVRKAAGIEGKAGRLSAADLHRAAVAFGSGEPKAPATPKASAKAAKPEGVSLTKPGDAPASE